MVCNPRGVARKTWPWLTLWVGKKDFRLLSKAFDWTKQYGSYLELRF